MNNTVVLNCKGLSKRYKQGPQQVEVLKNINLSIGQGEKVAIVGSSGSGKTTLLNMLGGLDTPCAGFVEVAGQDIAKLSEKKRGDLRNRSLGFVYQFHHLLGEFTALENVMMPLLIRGEAKKIAEAKALKLLGQVGLSERASHKPSELSGGERQRVAIIRALVTEPDCVLLDEPTGNLDQETALSIHQLMVELNETLGISFIIVTHDISLAQRMDRILKLKAGELQEI